MATAKKPTAEKTAAKAPRAKKAVATVEKPEPAARKKRTSTKSTTKLPASFAIEPKIEEIEIVIPHEEIALRAYFIAERRQQMGWDGDSNQDWSDAVSQLRAEALEKPLKKR